MCWVCRLLHDAEELLDHEVIDRFAPRRAPRKATTTLHEIADRQQAMIELNELRSSPPGMADDVDDVDDGSDDDDGFKIKIASAQMDTRKRPSTAIERSGVLGV